jgi:methyl-accepting chemotaxis protein/methyl-accepting chemotaxis protein-1 (serine sensor receptor)
MERQTMSFGAKLTTAQAALTVILFLVGGFSIFTIVALRGELSSAADVEAVKSQLLAEVEVGVAKMTAAQKSMVLGGLTSDTAGIAAARSVMQQQLDLGRANLDRLKSMGSSAGVASMQAEVAGSVAEWARLTPMLIAALEGQRFDEATRLQSADFQPLAERVSSQARRAVEAQREEMKRSVDTAQTRAASAQWIAIFLCVLAVGAAAFSFHTVRGSNLQLRLITSEIAEGASQVASAAGQVSSASQSMAQGSSEQAASLEQTSASTEEINSMTQKNAENARTAASEVETVDRMLKETNTKVGEMISSMREINASSEKIGRIIKVIDEIAFQTNILALNAAVEAARAGEAGMGFAVVADEVRNLAQRSAQAAKDTSELIEESIVRSNEGKSKLDDVAQWVSKVVGNAARISVLANEVHVGSQEQARGIDQISRSVAQMRSVTQSTAASAEQSASAGEMMSSQASRLNDAVTRLRQLVGASETALVSAAPATMARAPLARTAALAKPAPSARKAAPPAATGPAAFPMEDFQDF